jgi:SAM-dependent methyltransferase
LSRVPARIITAVMAEQILSFRFALPYASVVRQKLSSSQRDMVADFASGLANKEYGVRDESCPCGAHDDVTVAEIDRYGLPMSTVLCLACGCLRTNPYLDDESLGRFYRSTYQAMYARAPQLDRYFENQKGYGTRIAALYANQLPSGANVLEVGCGAGGALTVFHKLGCPVSGCDLSADLVEFGTQRGVPNLWHGGVENMPAAQKSRRWDLVFLHHVFEHVQSPRDALEQLGNLLTAKGRILAIVPDISRIDQFPNPDGDALRFLHVAHKFNYSTTVLEIVAPQTGLAARIRTPPAELKTAWSDMPELWMEFRKSASPTAKRPCSASRVGASVLQYLLDVEQSFLARQDVQAKPASWKVALRNLLPWRRGRSTRAA